MSSDGTVLHNNISESRLSGSEILSGRGEGTQSIIMPKPFFFYFRVENILKLYIGILLSALNRFTVSVTKPDQYALHKYR
jgi:hypothetical protein